MEAEVNCSANSACGSDSRRSLLLGCPKQYNRRNEAAMLRYIQFSAAAAITLVALCTPAQAQVLTTPGKSNGSSTVGGFPRDNRVLMLQGKVVLDDGKLPSN